MEKGQMFRCAQHDEGVGCLKPFHRSNCSFPLVTLNAVKGLAVILAKPKTQKVRCFISFSMTRDAQGGKVEKARCFAMLNMTRDAQGGKVGKTRCFAALNMTIGLGALARAAYYDEGVGCLKPFHRSNCSFPLVTLNAVKGLAVILAKPKTQKARCFDKSDLSRMRR
ncbi:MAG: hypothetical protein VB108_06430 [Anaerolineaceae bacterium]|nr:hypothetical protein [Anaerolineaceae bacterium]